MGRKKFRQKWRKKKKISSEVVWRVGSKIIARLAGKHKRKFLNHWGKRTADRIRKKSCRKKKKYKKNEGKERSDREVAFHLELELCPAERVIASYVREPYVQRGASKGKKKSR